MNTLRNPLAAAVLLVSLALATAGCGQLPQPFAKDHADLRRASFLIAPATEGVMVWPIIGVDDETADLLTEMTVEALQKRGVAASSKASNRSSLILTSAGHRLPSGALEVTWTLSRPDGVIVGERVDAIANDDRFAESIASVAAWVIPEPVVPGPPEDQIAVTVFGVGGAPGNGNDLLFRAIGQALDRADVLVTGDLPPDGHAIQGEVTVERLESGMDLVSVAWVVMDAQGRELGTVDQQNTVPPGYLDRNWGPVALPIATAAVDGVLDLIERTRQNQAAR